VNIKQFQKSYVAMIIVHTIITLGFALVFGTNHPFSSQYMINDLFPIILSTVTLSTLLYVLGGYLFIIAKENKYKLMRHIILAALTFILILAVIWFVSRTLSINGAHRNIWLFYVISNYPTAIIYNAIINLQDLHALELGLTVLPPALGFPIGAFLRLIHEPQWRKNL
jgi:low temperature requirement protein LtrA